MDDTFEYFVWDKPYSEYVLCCDCGYAFKLKDIFVKQYKNTAICLCRKCSDKLRKEIEEKFEA